MRWVLAFVLVAGCTQTHQTPLPFSAGRNTDGACAANPPGTTNGNVNHDDCLTDSDCGATGVCLCQAPQSLGGESPILGNACVGGNCRTDDDCSDGAGCEYVDSTTGSGYYCQTPDDECHTVNDCTATSPEDCIDCEWNPSLDHRICNHRGCSEEPG